VGMAGRGGCSELSLTAVLYFPHRERRTANSSAVLLWRDTQLEVRAARLSAGARREQAPGGSARGGRAVPPPKRPLLSSSSHLFFVPGDLSCLSLRLSCLRAHLGLGRLPRRAGRRRRLRLRWLGKSHRSPESTW
jgi:hypothetical protein